MVPHSGVLIFHADGICMAADRALDQFEDGQNYFEDIHTNLVFKSFRISRDKICQLKKVSKLASVMMS